ncbi:hypothetical protein BCR39DRAFT_559395 [Naematelia encephala]|uniref:Uncharacterized protein n=1 Tax=Naematelia encephala TaxID=71784 RepID=A0A1Y2B1Y6_9TREE|nr:hypothetical protein BCR39DRAFT_559395 [Naematelia encephala]
MAQPLFHQPASVYATDWHDDELDTEAVDQSLPSTPMAEKYEPYVHRSAAEMPSEAPELESDVSPSPEVDVSSEDHREVKPEQDEPQCRICFGGVEEEEMLGRLISPCLCSGSMRYVHVQCINAWRGTGTNAKAFMECPQCHHHYRLRRTLISGIATSRPLLLLLSSTFFLLLTLSSGALIHYLLLSPRLSSSILSPDVRLSTGNLFDLDMDDDYMYDGGGIVIIGGGTTLVADVVFGAIQAFTLIASRLSELDLGMPLPPFLSSIVYWLGLRVLLGISLLGSLSFISLLLSFSLFAPLQIANNFRGGFFRRFRTAQRTEGGGTSVGTIMIVLFVLVGAVNSMRRAY